MKSFESTSETELYTLVKERREVTVSIGDDITEFEKHIPEVDFSSPKQVSPTSLIYTKELAAEIIVHTGDDQKGKYIRLVAAVYWAQGKIFYRQLVPGKYELSIQWSKI